MFRVRIRDLDSVLNLFDGFTLGGVVVVVVVVVAT
jgi:hypothetical protein